MERRRGADCADCAEGGGSDIVADFKRKWRFKSRSKRLARSFPGDLARLAVLLLAGGVLRERCGDSILVVFLVFFVSFFSVFSFIFRSSSP